MQHLRPAFAANPMCFGRRMVRVEDEAVAESSSLASDIKLFAATFFAGFVFVSIFIG